MRFCCCFLLLLAALVVRANSYTLVAAELRGDEVSRVASLDSSLAHRRLRGNDAHFPDSEDRGDVVSSLVKSIQVQQWFLTGKTDDFVKAALKLDDMSEDAMIASPRYKYYVKFWLKSEGQRLKQWLKEGTDGLPLDKAWARLGLKKMDQATLKKSAEYKAYMRYEKMYDAEMYRRMDDWFKAGKSDDFVKEALSLHGLPTNVMEASPNYKYYVDFFLKTEPRRFKDWLSEGKGGLPTHWAWARLGLRNMEPATRDQSAAYKAYTRYAEMFDDDMYQLVSQNPRKAFRVVIGPFPEETSALLRVWVAIKRPDWYVRKMLGALRWHRQDTTDKRTLRSTDSSSCSSREGSKRSQKN